MPLGNMMLLQAAAGQQGGSEPAGMLFSDDFNRADGAVGATDWPANNWNVVSNQAVSASGFNPIRQATVLAADSWVECDLVLQSANNLYFGLMLRSSASTGGYTGDMYYVQMGTSGSWGFAKYVAGAFTGLSTGTTVHDSSNTPASFPLADMHVRFEVEGTTLRFYRDGVLHISQTDSSITAGGRAGLLGLTGVTIDNFKCGEIA